MSVNYEWYQTDQKVVVTVKIKQAAEKNCVVNITADRLTVTGDENINLSLDLLESINEQESGYKISPIKIEVTLKKVTGDRWPTLVKSDEAAKIPAVPMATLPTGTTTGTTAGSTSDAVAKAPRNHTDWDRLANDMYANEGLDKESDAEINGLFQKIYATATPEVRRAMNKSFTESGGTVLSTNWQEVGEKKVDVKPPEGTEFQKWE